jgi:hypothetical protein
MPIEPPESARPTPLIPTESVRLESAMVSSGASLSCSPVAALAVAVEVDVDRLAAQREVRAAGDEVEQV